MAFEVGKTYGDYDFLDVIRMSRTEIAYRVRNRLAQRLEILRVLPAHLQSDPQQVERFLREMRVHARLLHPNIAGFYHAGELERCVIMTTECVEGVTLRDRLALGPTPWQTAVDYVRQTLAALGSAHAQQIVHRDVTPDNIIITPEGTVKLNGFGLAKAASSPQLTQLGAVVGSPRYSSPEQIKGSAKIDGRSDLYSLGVVLYEAVAGRPPFSFGSQFELMLAQVSQAPEPPSHVNPLVPAALDSVVLRALEKDPVQRFQTAEEFWSALGNVKASLESEQTGPAVAISVEAAVRPADLAPPPALPAEPVAAPPELPVEPPKPVAVSPDPAIISPDPAPAAPEPVAIAAPEPVTAATPEPVAPAASEPAVIAAPEPVTVAAPEPVVIAASEPASVAVPEPTVLEAPVPEAPIPEFAPSVEMEATPEAAPEPAPPFLAPPPADVPAPEAVMEAALVADPPPPVADLEPVVDLAPAVEPPPAESADEPELPLVVLAGEPPPADPQPAVLPVQPAETLVPPRLFKPVASQGLSWRDLAIALVIAVGLMTAVLVYYVVSTT
jgi:hypothetical protein